MRSRNSAFVLALTVVLALVGGSPAAAITNPAPDNGEHPYVGLVRFETDGVSAGRCSGALLSPTVLLTAGHCTDGTTAARVWLGEELQDNPEYPGGGETSYEGVPHTFPEFCGPCGPGGPEFVYRDVGVVVLTEPAPPSVVDSFGTLPEPGAVDAMHRAAVDIVGYGVQERLRGGGQPVWSGPRSRYQAAAELIPGQFSTSDELLRLTGNPGQDHGGSCFGDSGGPVLVEAGTTVLGVNAHVNNVNCAGTSHAQRVDIPAVLTWIESYLS